MVNKELTEAQRRFCEEYLKDLSASAAAVRAGLAAQSGRELIGQDQVLEYVEFLKAQRSKRTQITADRVLQELAKIAFVDPRNIVSVDDGGQIVVTPSSALSDEDAACVSGVESTKDGVKIKLHDKIAALEKLGKHLKLFTDVSETNISFNKMGRVIYTQKTQDGNVTENALTFDVGSEANQLPNTHTDNDPMDD